MARDTLRSGTAAVAGVPVAGRWRVFTVIAAAFFLAFLSRYATAVIVPDLERSFAIGAPEIGLLGAAYFWAYALMQPPAGLLADSIGPRRAVTGFLLLAGAGTALFAVAGQFPLALAGRAVSGFGAGIVYVCGTKLFARWFGARDFGPVTGAFAAVGNAGGLTAAGPFAAAIAALGWRGSFVALALLIVASGIAVWLLVRDWPPGRGPEPGQASVLAGAGTVLRHPNTWLLGLYAFISLGVTASMQGLWAVPFLEDVYGMDRAAAANALTLWAVGLIIGTPLWGYLADRAAHSRRGVLLFSTALHTALWVLLVWQTAGLPRPLVVALLFWGGLTGGAWVPAYAQLKDSLPPAVAGTAVGFLNFAFFAGAAAFQQVTGLMLGSGGHRSSDAYRTMFAFFLVTLAVGLLALWRSRDAYPEPASRPD
jgi:predicted MFS family arabinose efflux permease